MQFKLNSLSPEQNKKLNAVEIRDTNSFSAIDNSATKGQEEEIALILSSSKNKKQNQKNCHMEAIYYDLDGKVIKKEQFDKLTKKLEYEATHPYMMSDQQDGIIGDFKQGQAGDCWFLASIRKLKDLPDQGKGILKETIKNNKNGTYTVNFKGGDGKPITVTEEEVQKGTIKAKGKELKLSSGDKDVRILEIAANKYIETHLEFNGRKNINGGNSIDAWRLLTGKPENVEYNAKKYNEWIEGLLLTRPSDEFTCSFNNHKISGGVIKLPGNIQVVNNHVYDIAKVTKENGHTILTLINPWDTSKPIKISYEEAAKLDLNVQWLAEVRKKPSIVNSYISNPFKYYN